MTTRASDRAADRAAADVGPDHPSRVPLGMSARVPGAGVGASGENGRSGAGSVVIVGAGHAGVETADALRRAGWDGPITLVDAAEHLPYQRPPLSKDYVGDVDPAPLPLRAEAFYDDRGIELMLGTEVVAIDRERCSAVLADGRRLPYDHLVLATGSTGREFAVPGADRPEVRTLRDLSDAVALRAALADCRRLVVVGAGFIGLELASAAEDQGLPVTVVDSGDRPLRRIVSAPMADLLRRLHEGRGARFVLGARVAGIDDGNADAVSGDGPSSAESGGTGRTADPFVPDPRAARPVAIAAGGADRKTAAGSAQEAPEGAREDGGVAVVLADGRRLSADLVVCGIGVDPAVAPAQDAGLSVDGGIVVDPFLRTSDPRVLAVGDCAVYPHLATGMRLRPQCVQSATDQARAAAAGICGAEEPYDAVPWFWTVQCGLKLQIAGVPAEGLELVATGGLAEAVDVAEQVVDGFPAAGSGPRTAAADADAEYVALEEGADGPGLPSPDLGACQGSLLGFADGRLRVVESLQAPGDHLAARRLLAMDACPLTPDEARAEGFSLKAYARGLA